ncbi:acyl-ACP thioesterase domain-containing protein [uncultured Thalassospira sp.]|uniref:acyl-[acyl-carrier-protein] thioesterase n=1 Tax=uncultured Thalassospira sp. TaxID=404382 RepID=UPI0025867319|nr:acyl-ACP thioesterase domain-containing protein [uncultured Thalassospira sp.]
MIIDWDHIAKAPLPTNCGWKGTYRVRYSEIGENGKVMMPALADYMQDAAGWGARILKLAYDDTVDQGIAWVLARMVIHIRDYPGNGGEILVETWPSGVSRRVATRDFRLSNSKGDVIGVAQSYWVMFDLRERRAAQWPDWIEERLPDPPGPKLIEPPMRPAFTTDPLPAIDTIKARPSDLDLYGHVNNVRLMQWVLGVSGQNSRPDFHPESLDIQFRTECRVHERVELRHANGFAAVSREEDSTDLVRAHIVARNALALA